MKEKLEAKCDAFCRWGNSERRAIFSESSHDERGRVKTEYSCGIGKNNCVILYLAKKCQLAVDY